jgi:hypothetical protein
MSEFDIKDRKFAEVFEKYEVLKGHEQTRHIFTFVCVAGLEISQTGCPDSNRDAPVDRSRSTQRHESWGRRAQYWEQSWRSNGTMNKTD